MNFNDFFFVFVNMGPYGSENFKTLLPQLGFHMGKKKKNEVRHGHFKSRNPTWPFIKTVESDVKVL